jgi:hypothetical protein
MKRIAKIVVGVVLFIIVLYGGCVRNDRVASESSPDGKNEAIVRYLAVRGNPAHDGRIRVNLASGWISRTVYANFEDRRPAIVEIAWSEDSKVFGVIEFDWIEGPLWFAYNVQEGRQIDSKLIENELRKKLIRRFGLEPAISKDSSFDPVDWIEEQYRFVATPTLPGLLYQHG